MIFALSGSSTAHATAAGAILAITAALAQAVAVTD